MAKRRILAIALVAVGGVLISVVSALVLRGDAGPDFTGKTPEEIKSYFQSEAFQRLNAGDQRTIKESVYGPIKRQQQQAFIDQARVYSHLRPPQKVRFLDEWINKSVAGKKQQQAARSTSGPARVEARSDSPAAVKPTNPKKTFTSEDYRGWTEKMEPEARAYVLELKEALTRRMEERAIGSSRQ